MINFLFLKKYNKEKGSFQKRALSLSEYYSNNMTFKHNNKSNIKTYCSKKLLSAIITITIIMFLGIFQRNNNDVLEAKTSMFVESVIHYLVLLNF
jgi:hypothetical protein